MVDGPPMPESTAEKDSKPCRGLECLPALGSGKCWLKVMIPRLGGCCWGRQGHGGQAIPTQLGPTGPRPDWRGPLSPGPLHTGRGYLSASPHPGLSPSLPRVPPSLPRNALHPDSISHWTMENPNRDMGKAATTTKATIKSDNYNHFLF